MMAYEHEHSAYIVTEEEGACAEEEVDAGSSGSARVQEERADALARIRCRQPGNSDRDRAALRVVVERDLDGAALERPDLLEARAPRDLRRWSRGAVLACEPEHERDCAEDTERDPAPEHGHPPRVVVLGLFRPRLEVSSGASCIRARSATRLPGDCSGPAHGRGDARLHRHRGLDALARGAGDTGLSGGARRAPADRARSVCPLRRL